MAGFYLCSVHVLPMLCLTFRHVPDMFRISSMYVMSLFCPCSVYVLVFFVYVLSILSLLFSLFIVFIWFCCIYVPVLIKKEIVQIPALLGCFDPLGSFGQESTSALQCRMVLWVIMIMMMLTTMMIESEHSR